MKSLLKDRICANFKTFWFVCVFGRKEWEKEGKVMTTLCSNLPWSPPFICTFTFFMETQFTCHKIYCGNMYNSVYSILFTF